ncbi:MAG: hypothetical protein LBL23_07445 [Coriobacteriales bacterium]|nr:hypothetical protein [Coriobacteriales bacterium]
MRAAKVSLLAALLLLAVLAIAECAESPALQNGTFGVIEALDRGTLDSSATEDDPLHIAQEGIVFVEANEGGSILWYTSSWNASQSRVLLERALVLSGWQTRSTEQEELLVLSYAHSAVAGGGSLYASFYETAEGSSILIELL